MNNSRTVEVCYDSWNFNGVYPNPNRRSIFTQSQAWGVIFTRVRIRRRYWIWGSRLSTPK